MGTIANLIVNVGADIGKFEQGIGKMLGGLGKIGGSFVKAGAVAASALGAGLGIVLNEGIGGIIAMEDASAQLEAVLKSTNGASGMTKDALLEMATAYQLTTKFAEEDVVAAENLLLTFTNIGQEVFPQATGTLLDMATAMGGDASSNAIQLGKALNDPVEGISSLSRVGVTFTDTQKAAIQSMVEMGDTAGAQKIILEELNKEFGGSAAAAGETFSGTMTRTKNALGEVAEGLASTLMPYLENFLTWVSANMPQIQATMKTVFDAVGKALGIAAEWVTGTFIPALQAAWDWISPYMPQIQAAVETAFAAVGDAISAAGDFILNTLYPALEDLWNWISPYMPQIQAAVETAFNAAKDAIQGTIDVFTAVYDWIVKNQEVIIPLAAGVTAMATAWGLWTAAQWLWNAAIGVGAAVSGAMAGAATWLAGAMAAISWPVVLVIAAIGALVAIGVLLYRNWDTIKAKATEIWENIKATFSAAWESIKTTMTNLWTSIVTTWNNLKTSVTTAANNIWTAVTTAFNNLKNSVSTAIQTAKDTVIRIFQGVLDWFRGLPDQFYTMGSNAFSSLKNGITSILNTITSVVSKGFDGAITFIKGLPGKAFTWGADFLNGIVNGIKSKIGAITSAISSVGSKIKSFLGFSVPDEGPLHEYESWMPDFMGGLAKGITKNKHLVTNALTGMSGEMSLKIAKPALPTAETKRAEENAEIVALLRQLLAKDTNIYLDGQKVNAGLFKYIDATLSKNETNARVATGGVF